MEKMREDGELERRKREKKGRREIKTAWTVENLAKFCFYSV